MKYALHHASPAIIWPGFHIETKTGDGAAKLAEELNRLDAELVRTREELQTQIEAKCNALRKVTDLEALGVELELKLRGTPTNRALKQRLSVRTSQVDELLTVLERAQGILADYIEPNGRVKPREALSRLLDILDDGALVSMMRNLRELIGVKDNGSVELTKADKLAVLKALDEQAEFLGKFTAMQPASYAEACRILGASEDGDVANGKQYLSGFGVGLQYCACVPGNQPFIVQADQVYINKRLVLDGITPTIGLVAEPTERVVNNTTNNFAPEYRLRRKERAALESAINKLEEDPGDIGLTDDEEAAQRLRKLLKKLS